MRCRDHLGRVAATRTLHVLDLENLGRGPDCAGRALARILGRFERLAGWAQGDHAIGAASSFCWRRVRFDLAPSLVIFPAGAGEDAADRRLLQEIDPAWSATHYARVVFGTGDHIFAPRARALRAAGVETWAIGWTGGMSAELARSVDEVRFIDAVRHAAPSVLAA